MNISMASIVLAGSLGLVTADGVAQEIKSIQPGGSSSPEDIQEQKIRQDIVAPWMVEVSGESRPRTLVVRSAEKAGDGTWSLDATYGFTDGRMNPVKVKLNVRSDGYRMEFVTASASQLVVEGGREGVLTGTFATKRGREMPVKLVKTGDGHIKQMAEELKASKAALVTPPGPEVPEMCSRYFGGWEGKWEGDPVPVRLWVLAVKADCTAQVRYKSTASKDVPEPSDLATVTIGTTGFDRRCGGDGNCRFVLEGQEMSVTYSHMTYATKSIAMKRFR
jgi:hypothetical protein